MKLMRLKHVLSAIGLTVCLTGCIGIPSWFGAGAHRPVRQEDFVGAWEGEGMNRRKLSSFCRVEFQRDGRGLCVENVFVRAPEITAYRIVSWELCEDGAIRGKMVKETEEGVWPWNICAYFEGDHLVFWCGHIDGGMTVRLFKVDELKDRIRKIASTVLRCR